MRRRSLVVLCLVSGITFIAFLIRLYRLDAVPFRGDEAFAVQNWSGLPLSVSLNRIATIEPHPVLTYVVFRGWGLLVGSSEFAARLLSVLFGVLGVPVVYRVGCLLAGRASVGVVAGGLWALHAYAVWHAQDARNYAIWVTLSLVVLWFGLRAVRRQDFGSWVLYSAACTVAVNVFYLEVLFLLGFGFWMVVVQRWWTKVVAWGWSQVVPFLTVVFSFLLLQWPVVSSGQYGGTVGVSWSVTDLITRFLPALTFGETFAFSPVGAGLLFAALLVVIAFLLYVRESSVFLLLVQVIVPVLLLTLLSLRLDTFASRYVLPASVYIVLLLALFVVRVRWLGFVGVSVWVLLSVVSLGQMWFSSDYTKSPDWPAVTAYLRQHVSCQDLVIQLSADAAFGYYYDACAPDIALPSSPQQSFQAIAAALSDATINHTSLWIAGRTFADWPNAGVVESWLDSHLQRVRGTQINGLLVEQFMPWKVQPSELPSGEPVAFGGFVQLIGWRIWSPEPDDQMFVWLYWRPVSTVSVPYKVFVHLEGDTNPSTGTPLWSQHDQYPQNGRISTQDWMPAAIYRDVYVLPLQAVAPGNYQINVGWYDSATLQRVLTDEQRDSYTIARLQLP